MSQENIVDLLGRKDEAIFLKEYLIANSNKIIKYNKGNEEQKQNSFVLNINANWGYGKTTFLKILQQELQGEKQYICVYYDAWSNDFSDEPLLGFISEIEENLRKDYFKAEYTEKIALKKAFSFAKQVALPILLKKGLSTSVEEITELLDSDKNSFGDLEDKASKYIESSLKNHKSLKENIKKFKQEMGKLLQKDSHYQKPMFILVDELDRCRPNYAIELLESIKHIFDISGVYFIVATDSEQLKHSINAVYGNNFDGERYLKRFFNQEYVLAKPKNYELINFLFKKYAIAETKLFTPFKVSGKEHDNKFVGITELFSEQIDLNARDLEQVIIVLNAIIDSWNKDEEIFLDYLIFLIMLRQKSNSLYLEYLDKRDSEIIFKEIKADVISIEDSDTLPLFEIISFFEVIIQRPKKQIESSMANKNYLNNINNKIMLLNSNNSKSSIDKLDILFEKYSNLVLQAGNLK